MNWTKTEPTATTAASPAAPRRGEQWFGRLFCLSAAAVGVVLTVVLLALGERSRPVLLLWAGLGCAGMLGLRQRRAGPVLGLLSWSGVIAALGVESALRIAVTIGSYLDEQKRRAYAATLGLSYDARSRLEVMEALRAGGEDAVLLVPARYFMRGLDVGHNRLLPLGGASNVTTVEYNETGQYLVFRSDEHGFHNPPGLWNLSKIQIALVGDSFAFGSSVPSDSNLGAALRSRYPKTLNLGYPGMGPLARLAAITEYLPSRRPDLVVWIFTWNDLVDDVYWEKNQPALRGYLEQPPKLQHLDQRQAEVDQMVRELLEIRDAAPPPWLPLRQWLGFRSIRAALIRAKVPPPDFATFRHALQLARDRVASWGGRLELVYLAPGAFAKIDPDGRKRAEVFRIAQELSVPTLDLERVFADAGRNSELFYPYQAGHYTPAGYRLAGQALLEFIDAMELAPLPDEGSTPK